MRNRARTFATSDLGIDTSEDMINAYHYIFHAGQLFSFICANLGTSRIRLTVRYRWTMTSSAAQVCSLLVHRPCSCIVLRCIRIALWPATQCPSKLDQNWSSQGEQPKIDFSCNKNNKKYACRSFSTDRSCYVCGNLRAKCQLPACPWINVEAVLTSSAATQPPVVQLCSDQCTDFISLNGRIWYASDGCMAGLPNWSLQL